MLLFLQALINVDPFVHGSLGEMADADRRHRTNPIADAPVPADALAASSL